MKLVPILTFLLFAACGPAGANSKVAGTYVLDTKAILTEMGKGNAEDAVQAKMAENMQSTLELAADGTAQMKGKFVKSDGKGTWKVDGDKITITTDKAEVRTGKIENGTITVEIPDAAGGTAPRHMIFRKK